MVRAPSYDKMVTAVPKEINEHAKVTAKKHAETIASKEQFYILLQHIIINAEKITSDPVAALNCAKFVADLILTRPMMPLLFPGREK
ncbi:MAG: hypothetical protein LBC30_02880 [Puniceicoccales bacterium]|nr:hypothetical protein [Puniceicoccales bacterium]